MSDYPHVPAAFINALSEEGTKAEAIAFLQEQWNETCALRAEIKSLRAVLASCPCPGGGWNGMPKGLEATVAACVEHKVCGCEFGRALEGRG